ncbi:uncharacterized protein [Chelonus insularis]|uniref:uncharacterized protein n=1 Tax=Chelonus insularis TaxID=460826 RepID=UPI00158C14B3|nr:uncharacterized protein LOC118066748 [Chelonus insularis]
MAQKSLNLFIKGRKKLCCVTCTINVLDVRCSSAQSFYHCQILRCRLLMASIEHQFIIGSPIPKNTQCFYVIITTDFYKSRLFQKVTDELNLKISEPQPVTQQAYINCLKYTIDFYIAPDWNKVANLYLEGEKFWAEKEKCSAIKYNIKLISPEGSDSDKISLELTSLKAKLFSVKLHHLCLPHSVIVDFTAGLSDFIDVSLFDQPRVSVLPSMIKGRVLYIFRKIPPTCPYKNWVDMRRHWKNMYGYRLPKTDEGIIYYEIYFPMFKKSSKPTTFIYPDLCIRCDLSEFQEPSDDIINTFIEDFNNIMPKIGASYEEIQEKNDNYSTNSKLLKIHNDQIGTKDDTNIVESAEPKSDNVQEFKKPTRLSSTAFERLNSRGISTPMSPTFSMLRKRSSSPKKLLNFPNLKKMKEVHESYKLENHQSSSMVDNHTHDKAFPNFNNPKNRISSPPVFSKASFISQKESNFQNIFCNFFHSRKKSVMPGQNTDSKNAKENLMLQFDKSNIDKQNFSSSVISDEKVSFDIFA